MLQRKPLGDMLAREVEVDANPTSTTRERIPAHSWDRRPRSRSGSVGESAAHPSALPSIFMPLSGVARTTGIDHVVHHRGQRPVYVRLLDVAVPPVYGPTVDE